MANKNLFQSMIGRFIPKATVTNEAGGIAYALEPRHALAQYAATGCLSGTFYATADEQLDRVLLLASKVEAEFVARTALYARQRGFMKDSPALLCAVLAVRDRALLERIFPRVIDNGRMLRNFVQIIRSGVTGRKSLGTAPKRLVRQWLESRSDAALLRDSVGQSPSIADVVKMVHPKPQNETREALYGYLIGRQVDAEKLPEVVREFEAFKSGESTSVPEVSMQMLTALELDAKAWREIARNASWTTTRMNLNTFLRHGVFEDAELVRIVAKRLSDANAIRKSRAFPYQLLAAYCAASKEMPMAIRSALQDAMEVATENVPAVNGRVVICPDVSGSMSSPVTGERGGGTTAMRCIDVAALVSATVLRKNSDAIVLPFEQRVVEIDLNPRDSVMTNAAKLAAIGGGGTNCSAPLARLNKANAHADLIVIVSDNESWVDVRRRATATMEEWEVFRRRNPNARLVCIDIQPYGTVQATERDDILNVGGFSDAVFEMIAQFAEGRLGSDHWIGAIEAMDL